ncbi:alcohol dehydrogenase [Nostoc carneum NIES-2107]|nr:alcohol dehydrogenase [Nostoc carneum NIES-2107]
MTSSINQQILLKSRPLGEPKESDFALVETPIPEPGEGEVLNRTIYLSLDPYMRGRMSDRESYAAPVELGSVMAGGTVSQVMKSNHPNSQPEILCLVMTAGKPMAYRKAKLCVSLTPIKLAFPMRWA